jgi:signal transduction histidine kinase
VTNGSGAGLIGMRERVALFGGSLVVDTDDRHVFSVKATLPNTPETA